ncbi:bifunctional UDP-sugar hydrolase/5'-nucleotidase [Georgenia halophila]|uniref:Bifunctional UDP-sugar hydrolase/5'-nucleotidase n=1 Tax=Georgenia halophila TaxID=620889 RepID=A0ABP8KZ70_9MICO
MRSARARRRAAPVRPAATLGALSLCAVGLTALPAAADTVTTTPMSVEADGSVSVDVLAVTDLHGHIETTTDEDDGTIEEPGAALLAGAVNSFRDANEDTVFVSVGDNIGGSAYVSGVQDDVPTIEILNEMDLFTSAAGNHEFDQGYDDLAGRVSDLAEFSHLAANAGGTPLAEYGADDDLSPYDVWTSPNGVDVGFVGAVTTEMPSLVNPKGIAGINWEDEAPSINRAADALSDGDPDNGEADVVIALAHAEPTRVAAGLNANVDALVGGHTHTTVDDTITGIEGNPVVTIQPGYFGSHLAHLAFTYDPADDSVEFGDAGNIDLAAGGYDPDPEVAALVEAAVAQADIAGQAVIGEASEDLLRGAGGENRGVESTIGNFLGDVALWSANQISGADIGVMNSGGVRNDFSAGEVTYKEAYDVQPFGNTIATVDLTGGQLIQVLEEQWQPEGADRPLLRLGLSSNVTYYYDPSAQAGSHITQVLVDGEPIDPDATYTVAGNNFLLAGGDNFTTFTEGVNYLDTGTTDLQFLVDYFAEVEAGAGAVAPEYTQRSIGVSFVSDPTATSGGEEVVIELASLSFTNDEPKPEAVTVLMDGTQIGEFPIDNSVVPDLDDTGRATISFTMPDLEAYEVGDAVTFELVFGANEDSMQTVPLELEVLDDGGLTPGQGPTTDDGSLETLPETGAGTTMLGAVSAALVLLGILTMVSARRRPAERTS